MQDFIRIYDEALSVEICQKIIINFEGSMKRQVGITGQGQDIRKKDSEDIQISAEPEWQPINTLITQATLQYLVKYMREYSHLLTGALCPAVPDPKSGELVYLSSEHIESFSEQTIANIVSSLYCLGSINAQKYLKDKGGYHHYHSEIYPSLGDRSQDSLHRVLFFMYYLNNVTEGGETEFFYQKKFIIPKTGRLLIAPAGFTHTHKGHIPASNDKYILTSWILFRRAEHIFELATSPF